MNVPVVAKMIRHDDGSYSVDKEHSQYAEVPTETVARLLRREYDREQRESAGK